MPLLKTRGCSGVEPVGSRMKRRRTMTLFEKTINKEIVAFYTSYRWIHEPSSWLDLAPDERQIVARAYWEDKLWE